MKLKKQTILLIMIAGFVSSILQAEEPNRRFVRDPLPTELQDVLLATPEIIRPSDYGKLLTWLREVKLGLEKTVRISNPEFSVSDVALFGVLEVERGDLENFEQSCGEIRSGYFWLENKMHVLQQLLKMTEELVPLVSSDPDLATSKMVAVLFQAVLDYRDQVLAIERSLDSVESLEATYYWAFPKEALVESLNPTLNPKVLSINPLLLNYPGLSWSQESLEEFTDLGLVKSMPSYKHGGINFHFSEDLRSLCMDQFYFRLVTDLHYSFESIPLDSEINERELVQKKRTVTLHGHVFETHATRMFQNSHSLRTLRELSDKLEHSLGRIGDTGAFDYYLQTAELEFAKENCRKDYRDHPKQTYATCIQVDLQRKKHQVKWAVLNRQMIGLYASKVHPVMDWLRQNSDIPMTYWHSLFYGSGER